MRYPDGFTAAWIAHRALSQRGPEPELVFSGYGDKPPNVAGRDVYIVDFSYPREVMSDVIVWADKFICLDHHKTAQAALAGLPCCTFDMNESGASLAWKYFHGDAPNHAPVPTIVQYVRDNDLYKHELPHSKEVSAWINTFPYDLKTWDDLHTRLQADPGMRKAVFAGQALLRKNEKIVDEHRLRATSINLAGTEFRVCNATVLFSEIGSALSQDTGAGAVWFVKENNRVHWSLRGDGSKRVDVSEVAKNWGGGGHANAAGFVLSWEEHVRLCQNRD